MSKTPPNCYICEKHIDVETNALHYCMCDTAVCDECVNSCKKNEKVWICPQCKREVDFESSRLLRNH